MKYEIGDIIRIISCPEASRNNGCKGTILYIEDGYLYGDWSDEILYPSDEFDVIEKIGHEEVSERTTRLCEMSSKKDKAKDMFEGGLREGIIHLIKIYAFRNITIAYDYKWMNEWIGTVYRNVAVGNEEEEKSYLTEIDYDFVVSKYLDKFKQIFKKAQTDVIEDDYPLQISDKDLDGAEEFVEKYLEWAKPRLLKYQQIPKNEVINKIYEMLGKVKD